MNEREKLLQRVRMYDFALVEVITFLDGHPKNGAALEYFKKMQQAYDKALEEYESSFGPLTAKAADASAGSWSWIQDPWPWEGADN